MDVAMLLALPNGFGILHIDSTPDQVTIQITSTDHSSCCPLCAHPATRIHSLYSRSVVDLPCGGRPVHLLLHTRKFFCDVGICPRKIFVERLLPFIAPWARMTARLSQTIQHIGLATCGMTGKRLADRMGISTSWMTILRRIMAIPGPGVQQVLTLGIDDFAFRRGRIYGSILVDLDLRRIIDLLPDRKAETATKWMGAHPEIAVVSRDRGGEYATAAQQGAPQAQQVADRFHIVKNLVETTENVLARCQSERRRSSVPLPLTVDETTVTPLLACPAPSSREQMRRSQYEQLMVLRSQGLSHAQLVEQTQLSVRTIHRWLAHGSYPATQYHRTRRSRFHDFIPFIEERWSQGCHNVAQLWREAKGLGYPHSVQRFYANLQPLLQSRKVPEIPPPPLTQFIAKEVVWSFIRDPKKLTPQEYDRLNALCETDGTLMTLYTCVQDFMGIVHVRSGEVLDPWIEQAKASSIPELQRFVAGLERDKVAVQAGLTVSTNNGPVEGFVNKLKLIKRTMFGRAGFALLRQRVLHAL